MKIRMQAVFLHQVILVLLAIYRCDGGKFWHISDIHLDYEYMEGGNISDWCHLLTEQASVDTEGGPAGDSVGSFGETAGPAGDYHCDSPYALAMSALLAMQRLEPNPDFIVWTGDSAPHWHNPAPPDAQYILNVTHKVFTRLDRLFPGVQVVPALGNHDAAPPDQFPVPSQEQPSPEYYQDLWKKGAFGDHIETEEKANFEKCGYYSKLIKSNITTGLNLKFVVLNTNLYYSDKFATGPDPCGQLDWLENILNETDETKVKLVIVAHVPPGSFELRPGRINFNTPAEYATDIHKRFISLVSSESSARKISAHLYGHLHTDTFRLFLDRATKNQPRGVAFMAGSITPLVWGKSGAVGVNPTIRLVTYDDSDLTLQDYEVFSLDIVPTDNKENVASRGNSKFLGSRRRKRDSMDDSPEETLSLIPQSTVQPRPALDTKAVAVPRAPSGASGEGLGVSPVSYPAVPGVTVPPSTNVSSNTSQDTETRETITAAETPATNSSDILLTHDKSFGVDIPATENSTIYSNSSVIIKADNISPNISSISTNTSSISTNTSSISTNTSSISLNTSSISTNISTDLSTNTSTDLSTNTTVGNNGNTTNDSEESINNINASNLTLPDPPSPSAGPADSYIQDLASRWQSLYKATSTFKVDNLTAASMFSSYKQMVEEDWQGDTFTQYLLHNTGGHDIRDLEGPCEAECWIDHLCSICNLVGEELDECLRGTVGDLRSFFNPQSNFSVTVMVEEEAEEDSRPTPWTITEEEILKSQSSNPDVTRLKMEDAGSTITTRVVSIFLGVFGVALVVLLAMFGYKKWKENRFRNQEFLLTDSVFRYDGYSQLEDD